MISFGHLEYSLYIAIVTMSILALFALFLVWKRRIINGMLRTMSGWEKLINGSRRITITKNVLVIVSILVAALVLLRPQWGDKMREINSEGADLLIALDVSNSMLATDVGTSRLDRAKTAIKLMAESLHGDRIGLILFAGDAFLQCPLTNDIGAFMMFLDGADPSAIRVQGTNIGRALEEGLRVFEKKRLTSKMFVLITDGEDHEQALAQAIGKFKEKFISVYTIGVGRENGDVIPVRSDDDTADNFFRDRSGNLVQTKKNVQVLTEIAGSTLANYIDISDNFSGLSRITEVLDTQDKKKYGSRMVREKREQYQLFALILIVLLSVELMLPERGFNIKKKKRGSESAQV